MYAPNQRKFKKKIIPYFTEGAIPMFLRYMSHKAISTARNYKKNLKYVVLFNGSYTSDELVLIGQRSLILKNQCLNVDFDVAVRDESPILFNGESRQKRLTKL